LKTTDLKLLQDKTEAAFFMVSQRGVIYPGLFCRNEIARGSCRHTGKLRGCGKMAIYAYRLGHACRQTAFSCAQSLGELGQTAFHPDRRTKAA